jgi:hypothetical protein
MALRAIFHFSVNRLWINADLRGTKQAIRIGEDVVCSIQFPEKPDDFGLNESPAAGAAIKGYVGSAGSDPRESPIAVQVHMVRVVVEGPGDISAADFVHPGSLEFVSATTAAFSAVGEFHDAAVSVLGAFLTWVRTTRRQFWLGLSGEPSPLVWRTELRDGDGNRLPVGYPGIVTKGMAGAKEVSLSSEETSEIIDHIERGDAPALHKVFLSDAQYIAKESPWRNLRQAVLMAAIACEVAVKQFLRAAASPEQQELVELVLSNPRDVSLAAATLFDKGCKAVVSRSLKEENASLYKRVDKLFQDRNKIAHRGGEGLADDVLAEHVATAREVLEWLSTVV